MIYSAEFPFERIIFYVSDRIDRLETQEIASYIHSTIKKPVVMKEDFFHEHRNDKIFESIASTRVADLNSRKDKDPLPMEIEIEKKILKGKGIYGILYDGWKLSKNMFELLSEEEQKDHIIVITDRLIGTLERGESRYHVRTVINSLPSIISIPGIVEGPAKPKEFYLETEKRFDFKPMEHEDIRMTKAVKSYALQTIFWRLTGDPFCDKIGCPLFNSHWQEEVIKNQIEGELCEEHKAELKRSV